MCGFVGVIDPAGLCSPEALSDASAKLIHRGPDDAGVWSDGPVAMAHRRLAILDLSPAGHQPMMSHDGRYVIAYNGEIYNFNDLRDELTGITWRGTSDTEVILEAIVRWGLDGAVQRFIGMFAFALYDRNENSLFLVRDRLGIKPLYYGRAGSMLVFASEISALECLPKFDDTLDRDALAAYFRFSNVPAPHSIYGSIRKLLPGTVARFSCTAAGLKADPAFHSYWTLEHHDFDTSIQEADAAEQLLTLLRDAVKIRMLADVPVGAFLSGGVDSSLVCALMQEASIQPVRTFTIGFEEDDFNEAEYARAVAAHLKTDHTDLYVSEREMLRAVERMPEICDEPFADASLIPTYLLSQLTRREVTVALSGDGGDELFWGYGRYPACNRIWSVISNIPEAARPSLGRLMRSSLVQTPLRSIRSPSWIGKGAPLSARLGAFAEKLKAPSHAALYHELMSHWKQPEQLVLDSSEPTTIYNDTDHWTERLPEWKRMAVRDLYGYLPNDILTKVDRASMAVSLEARVPLLDHRVVEYSYALPESLIRPGNTSKYLLKKLLAYYVPPELTERRKMGFGVPMASWLRGPLSEWMEDLLSEDALRRQGILNPDLIRERVQSLRSGQRDWSAYLWDVLMFQSWLRKRKT